MCGLAGLAAYLTAQSSNWRRRTWSSALPLRNHKTGRVTEAMANQIDRREQLFNTGETGPVHEIALPQVRITTLRGIMLDLDPHLLVEGNPIFPPADAPAGFLDNIRPV